MWAHVAQGLAAHLRRERALFLLALGGVALGVAAVISIQIVNTSAMAAFEGSLEAISGDAELSVLGRVQGVSETIYPRVLAQVGVSAAWPLIRIDVARLDAPGEYLEVLGVDLFAPRRLAWREPPRDFVAALSDPGWAAITPELAAAMRLDLGDRFDVGSGSRRVRLHVGAIVDFRQVSPLASSRLVVLDVSQAQALFGRVGRLDAIDVRLAPGAEIGGVRAALARDLGPAVRVVTQDERRAEALGLLAAFRLNLTALSLVSLFVGGFLVYTSTQAALLRRRTELGLLRSLGATRGQVVAAILTESALLGLLGVALGILLGRAAAALSVAEVSRTLSHLYLLQQIEELRIPGWLWPLAVGSGLLGAVGGALLPAIDAARSDPRALLTAYTLQDRAGRAAAPLAALSAGLLGLSLLAVWLAGPEWRPRGFVLAAGILLALPLLAPALLRIATRGRAAGFGLRYGAQALGLSLGRSAVAVAALAVAVAMLVAVTLMIGSFRRTVDEWIQASVRADVYVTSSSWARGRELATLDPEVVAAVATRTDVRAVDQLRQLFVESDGRRIALSGVDLGIPVDEPRFTLLTGRRDEALRRGRDEGAVLISEPLARKSGLNPGETLPILTERGLERLPIAAVYHDYGREGGAAIVDLSTLSRLFGPGPVNSLAIYLEPGGDPERTAAELRVQFAGQPLEIRSNRLLREQALAIFDQTFAVTRLMQGMSLLIAASGITLTLLILAGERVGELALYRALGASRAQVWRVFMGKGLGLALAGSGLGAIGGVALAVVLVRVIHRDWFGWTIAWHWPWRDFAGEFSLLMAAALVASLYPAWRATRIRASELTRENLG